MTRDGAIHGSVNGQVYRATVKAIRPVAHFTPRIVPRHPDASSLRRPAGFCGERASSPI